MLMSRFSCRPYVWQSNEVLETICKEGTGDLWADDLATISWERGGCPDGAHVPRQHQRGVCVCVLYVCAVCMCMCASACVRVHACECMWVCASACECTRVSACVSMCVCKMVCVWIKLDTCVYTCTDTSPPPPPPPPPRTVPPGSVLSSPGVQRGWSLEETVETRQWRAGDLLQHRWQTNKLTACSQRGWQD